MKIFLIRHTDAMGGMPDAARVLSPRGRAEVAQLVVALRERNQFHPLEIWHSTLVRARETATLLAQGLGLSAPLIVTAGLTPEDDPRVMAVRLGLVEHDVAVVGHEPHLTGLAEAMIFPPGSAPRFGFEKGAVLELRRIEHGWTPEWETAPSRLPL